MSALLNPWVVIALIAYSAALAGTSYTFGRIEERQALTTRLQDGRISVLKDGKAIDNEILGADDSRLCLLLGGCRVPDGSGSD